MLSVQDHESQLHYVRTVIWQAFLALQNFKAGIDQIKYSFNLTSNYSLVALPLT